eukprot:TRINITY_DN984_c0_g1_i1.p1 TRINITY_DN984_c0_g1~~TRINITY_DN984_c0_g1_i1.p1  ORF type:complete len:364 (+),score=101.47 TRINITY_DN984_c0_g1_i1:168-1259(+)
MLGEVSPHSGLQNIPAAKSPKNPLLRSRKSSQSSSSSAASSSTSSPSHLKDLNSNIIGDNEGEFDGGFALRNFRSTKSSNECCSLFFHSIDPLDSFCENSTLKYEEWCKRMEATQANVMRLSRSHSSQQLTRNSNSNSNSNLKIAKATNQDQLTPHTNRVCSTISPQHSPLLEISTKNPEKESVMSPMFTRRHSAQLLSKSSGLSQSSPTFSLDKSPKQEKTISKSLNSPKHEYKETRKEKNENRGNSISPPPPLPPPVDTNEKNEEFNPDNKSTLQFNSPEIKRTRTNSLRRVAVNLPSKNMTTPIAIISSGFNVGPPKTPQQTDEHHIPSLMMNSRQQTSKPYREHSRLRSRSSPSQTAKL